MRKACGTPCLPFTASVPSVVPIYSSLRFFPFGTAFQMPRFEKWHCSATKSKLDRQHAAFGFSPARRSHHKSDPSHNLSRDRILIPVTRAWSLRFLVFCETFRTPVTMLLYADRKETSLRLRGPLWSNFRMVQVEME